MAVRAIPALVDALAPSPLRWHLIQHVGKGDGIERPRALLAASLLIAAEPDPEPAGDLVRHDRRLSLHQQQTELRDLLRHVPSVRPRA